MYHVSCEPLRIFWNDDTTCSTRVPRVLSATGWKARNSARSRQHAWYSCRAGCIIISENPQGLATHIVRTSILFISKSTSVTVGFLVRNGLGMSWRASHRNLKRFWSPDKGRVNYLKCFVGHELIRVVSLRSTWRQKIVHEPVGSTGATCKSFFFCGLSV